MYHHAMHDVMNKTVAKIYDDIHIPTYKSINFNVTYNLCLLILVNWPRCFLPHTGAPFSPHAQVALTLVRAFVDTR